MTEDDREAILQGAASAMLREMGGHTLRRNLYSRTVSYPQPPLILAPREDNLHLVRRPLIKMNADEAIVVFAQAIDALLAQNTTSLSHAVGGPASKMIRRFSAIPSQVVALLWYLAGAEGTTLDYDERGVSLSTREFKVGLRDGEIVSPFVTQRIGDVNPAKVLIEGGEQCRSAEPLFVAAYQRARRHGKHLAEGMAVLYQATTPQGFKQYVGHPPAMLASKCRKIEGEVMEGRDPLLKVYKALVPRWMQHSEFSRTFGTIEGRDVEPDVTKRSVILNKLAMQDFFKQ